MGLTFECWRLGALLEQAFKLNPRTGSLNQTQLLILIVLLEQADRGLSRRRATPTRIATAIGCGRSRTSMQLKALVELELLQVSAGHDRPESEGEPTKDHRQRYFRLTKRGAGVAQRVKDAIDWVDSEIRKAVTAKKNDAAVRTIAEARDVLEAAPFFVGARKIGRSGRGP